MLLRGRIVGFLTLVTMAAFCHAQGGLATRAQGKPPEETAAPVVPHAAEDISGMYSFLKDGEFLQINLEKAEVTGYISRMGDSESDHGVFMDQFFARADIQDHAVSFTTRPLHSLWYEFKGRFDRGPAKAKTDDGYYILRGTLKEFTSADGKNATERSRQVEFKLLAQPDDSNEADSAKDQPAKDQPGKDMPMKDKKPK
ncbi:MAG TPA: hypothetical protein VGK22_09345 [Candidatus Angelobacter sp.]|jgi:hypothetical protein